MKKMDLLPALLLLVLVGLILIFLLPARIKGESGKLQTVDVFSGKPINRLIYADWDGDRLYFCCNKSKNLFLGDPVGNVQKIHKKGIVLDRAPMQQ